ncbi:uncharacterized protein N7459_008993 [Penicillium hispanicum]|uniref:uncharacterized protein n=1 Tax=Penicillium hispanicum TaxID=1080232 RepID=UPI00253FF456|nr:uncharacterized protein N7459_008993 [Penicillium hispanicum]KAJ5569563.1 hypothetical protein N7459_008993 [Penicillium hispanicum]
MLAYDHEVLGIDLVLVGEAHVPTQFVRNPANAPMYLGGIRRFDIQELFADLHCVLLLVVMSQRGEDLVAVCDADD